MLATAEGILTQKDAVTSEGLQEVFAANLFGHFLLVSFLQFAVSIKWQIFSKIL